MEGKKKIVIKLSNYIITWFLGYLKTFFQLTISTELDPSCEANSCSASHKIPNILWDLEDDYHVDRSLLLIPILSQIKPFHTHYPISLKSILILSFNLSLGFPTKTMYALPFIP
jgi:hypothetical protein